MTKKNKINDKDIESVIRYLKIHDPENATPEKAISMLEDLRRGYHNMAHHNPQQLEELQKELDENKQADKFDSTET